MKYCLICRRLFILQRLTEIIINQLQEINCLPQFKERTVYLCSECLNIYEEVNKMKRCYICEEETPDAKNLIERGEIIIDSLADQLIRSKAKSIPICDNCNERINKIKTVDVKP